MYSLLEAILTDNKIPIPEYDDWSLALATVSAGRAPYWWSFLAIWRKFSVYVVLVHSGICKRKMRRNKSAC